MSNFQKNQKGFSVLLLDILFVVIGIGFLIILLLRDQKILESIFSIFK